MENLGFVVMNFQQSLDGNFQSFKLIKKRAISLSALWKLLKNFAS